MSLEAAWEWQFVVKNWSTVVGDPKISTVKKYWPKSFAGMRDTVGPTSRYQ